MFSISMLLSLKASRVCSRSIISNERGDNFRGGGFEYGVGGDPQILEQKEDPPSAVPSFLVGRREGFDSCWRVLK